jgi:multidrug efflux pump
VLVGGLTLGTLLTLFVVPVAYTLIGGKRRKVVSVEEAEAMISASQAGSGGTAAPVPSAPKHGSH